MTNRTKYTKVDFVNFVISTAEYDSLDSTKAREYLSSQGYNIESILSESLKKIKRIRSQINAEKTRSEMHSTDIVHQKACEYVDQLMADSSVTVVDIIRQEGLTMSFRNVEELSKEDIRDSLINHYVLKFWEEYKK